MMKNVDAGKKKKRKKKEKGNKSITLLKF